MTFTATVSPVAPGRLRRARSQFSIDGVNVGAPVALSAAGMATFSTDSHGSWALTPWWPPTAGRHLRDQRQRHVDAGRQQGCDQDHGADGATTTAESGNQIRLTATVGGGGPGTGTPTGTGHVHAQQQQEVIEGTANVGANGVATLNWTPAAADIGTWTVTATYGGDANFVGSFGTIENQRVR